MNSTLLFSKFRTNTQLHISTSIFIMISNATRGCNFLNDDCTQILSKLIKIFFHQARMAEYHTRKKFIYVLCWQKKTRFHVDPAQPRAARDQPRNLFIRPTEYTYCNLNFEINVRIINCSGFHGRGKRKEGARAARGGDTPLTNAKTLRGTVTRHWTDEHASEEWREGRHAVNL